MHQPHHCAEDCKRDATSRGCADLAYVDASKTCVNFVGPGTGSFPAFPPQERHPR
jgi:hypothetical protein